MYKPFIFAADNLTDMNKYKCSFIPNCYSETEAEDDDHSKAPDVLKKQTVQSPLNNTPGASPISIKEKGAEGVQMPNVTQSPDDLELMMTCLKQGGVSLIGKKTAMTRDEYRKSFIKRNKNPDINHKAHALRVLQSTLKAKLQELEALNQILDNPNLDSAIFQKWKSEHDQLYVNVGKGSQATAKNVYSMDVEGSNDQKKQDSDESEATYRYIYGQEISVPLCLPVLAKVISDIHYTALPASTLTSEFPAKQDCYAFQSVEMTVKISKITWYLEITYAKASAFVTGHPCFSLTR
ncbi:hypothetical protein AB205_0066230, partial [Aquarana catesbeiana]